MVDPITVAITEASLSIVASLSLVVALHHNYVADRLDDIEKRLREIETELERLKSTCRS